MKLYRDPPTKTVIFLVAVELPKSPCLTPEDLSPIAISHDALKQNLIARKMALHWWQRFFVQAGLGSKSRFFIVFCPWNDCQTFASGKKRLSKKNLLILPFWKIVMGIRLECAPNKFSSKCHVRDKSVWLVRADFYKERFKSNFETSLPNPIGTLGSWKCHAASKKDSPSIPREWDLLVSWVVRLKTNIAWWCHVFHVHPYLGKISKFWDGSR